MNLCIHACIKYIHKCIIICTNIHIDDTSTVGMIPVAAVAIFKKAHLKLLHAKRR